MGNRLGNVTVLRTAKSLLQNSELQFRRGCLNRIVWYE